jgi:RNA polymerase II subunit A small phosphatase-like protein
MDIDECMIHAAFENDGNKIREPGVNQVKILCEDGVPAYVNERPGIHEFLQKISAISDVYAFTAGLDIYARSVIKHLDSDGKIFKKVWFRESCTPARIPGFGTVYAKDLELLGDQWDPARTILVDNNIFSFLKQPVNGLLVPSFFKDPNDKALYYTASFIEQVNAAPDVRPTLYHYFKVPDQLNRITSRSRKGAVKPPE